MRSAARSARAEAVMRARASPCAASLPVAQAHVDPALRVEQAEGGEGRLEAGHSAGRSRHHRRPTGEVGRHDRVRRDVAGAAEVLEQGPADDVLVEQGQKGRRLAHA